MQEHKNTRTLLILYFTLLIIRTMITMILLYCLYYRYTVYREIDIITPTLTLVPKRQEFHRIVKLLIYIYNYSCSTSYLNLKNIARRRRPRLESNGVGHRGYIVSLAQQHIDCGS